jgi:hypothetical protein
LNADRIREENLPADERSRLAIEGYVQGIQEPQPSLAPVNTLAASLAALSILHLISGQALPHASVIVDVWEQFVQPLRADVVADCICHQWRSQADEFRMAFRPSAPLPQR